MATAAQATVAVEMARRSGNWSQPRWSREDIESLTFHGDNGGEAAVSAPELENLKEHVRRRLLSSDAAAGTAQLELVDIIQQLGVAYHFKEEIHQVLASISRREAALDHDDDLYATALRFRLLRSNGFNAPQDVFDDFKDNEEGKFKPSLSKDVKGLLGLYEASFLSMPGEATLADAKDFATWHLRNRLLAPASESVVDIEEVSQVTYALELPLHWRAPRLHARWFIDAYERRRRHGSDSFDPLLLLFAKLDFNTVQGVYKEELRGLSRWWSSELRLAEKVGFARDRILECFFWGVIWAPEPELREPRLAGAKATALISAVDDLYDVYGSVDELQLFTEAVVRWDVNVAENLPECMKLVFLSLFNMVNEDGYAVLRDKGVNAIPHLRRAYADLCKGYLREAEWYHGGYTPTLEEYLEVSSVTIATHVVLAAAYFASEKMTREAMDAGGIDFYPEVLRKVTTMFRIYDDLGTASHEKERGDVAKCLECYIHENEGATESDARDHMASLVDDLWDEVNGAHIAGSGCWEKLLFRDAMVNFLRAAQCVYQSGDGFGETNELTVQRIVLTILEPIPPSD